MEKAVVTTDVGDVASYIDNGVNGFVVDVADPIAVADRVTQLLDSHTLRQDFGEKARQVAVSKLDISICARRHKIAYSKSLSRSKL